MYKYLYSHADTVREDKRRVLVCNCLGYINETAHGKRGPRSTRVTTLQDITTEF